MTYKDKMVLTVLLNCRTRIQSLLDDAKDDLRSNYLQGGYDALCLAISLLRYPLSLIIETYSQFVNNDSIK